MNILVSMSIHLFLLRFAFFYASYSPWLMMTRSPIEAHS